MTTSLSVLVLPVAFLFEKCFPYIIGTMTEGILKSINTIFQFAFVVICVYLTSKTLIGFNEGVSTWIVILVWVVTYPIVIALAYLISKLLLAILVLVLASPVVLFTAIKDKLTKKASKKPLRPGDSIEK